MVIQIHLIIHIAMLNKLRINEDNKSIFTGVSNNHHLSNGVVLDSGQVYALQIWLQVNNQIFFNDIR